MQIIAINNPLKRMVKMRSWKNWSGLTTLLSNCINNFIVSTVERVQASLKSDFDSSLKFNHYLLRVNIRMGRRMSIWTIWLHRSEFIAISEGPWNSIITSVTSWSIKAISSETTASITISSAGIITTRFAWTFAPITRSWTKSNNNCMRLN